MALCLVLICTLPDRLRRNSFSRQPIDRGLCAFPSRVPVQCGSGLKINEDGWRTAAGMSPYELAGVKPCPLHPFQVKPSELRQSFRWPIGWVRSKPEMQSHLGQLRRRPIPAIPHPSQRSPRRSTRCYRLGRMRPFSRRIRAISSAHSGNPGSPER